MKRKKFDWNLVRSRYLAGEEMSSIARDLQCSASTLNSRANRTGLPELRRQMQTARISRENKSIESLSDLVRQKLANDALQTLERVDNYAIAELSEESKREQVIASVAKRSALVFGWEESQQSAQVNINLLSAMPDKKAVDI